MVESYRVCAEEQIGTYAQQEKAAGKERELREAEAGARTQQALIESELSITIQSNQGKADEAVETGRYDDSSHRNLGCPGSWYGS